MQNTSEIRAWTKQRLDMCVGSIVVDELPTVGSIEVDLFLQLSRKVGEVNCQIGGIMLSLIVFLV